MEIVASIPWGRASLAFPARGQVLRRILLGVMPKGKRVWIQIPAGPAKGVWLKIDPYLEAQYISGFPEPAVQAEIARHLRPGGCFYDVGAHIGFYSLMVERLMGGIGQVMAFEPDPNNVIELRENLSRNGFSGTKVVSAAVWSHSGVVNFKGAVPDTPRSQREEVLSWCQWPSRRIQTSLMPKLLPSIRSSKATRLLQ